MLTASSSSLPTGSLAARAIQLAKEPTPFMRKAAGASAAAVLALGLLALPFASDGKGVQGLSESGGQTESAAAPASAELPAASFDSPAASYSLSTGGTTSADRRAFTAPHGTGTTPAAKPKPATKPGPAATKPEQQAGPLAPITSLLDPLLGPIVPGGTPSSLPANVGLNLGGHDLGVGAVVGSTPAAGVEVDDTVAGTTDPATPTTPGAVVQVGPVTIPVPLPLP